MKGSVKLFRIIGISLEIHITFLILPVFFWLMYGIKGVFIILAIFTCVAAHELTHSAVAKNCGVNVDRIILLPIGGIASMRSMPETPIQEFAISIAGPLFNIILAVILYYPLRVLLGPEALFAPNANTWPGAIAYAYWVNPVLAAFNLLPAFPMDGGRVLRSLLARKLSYQKATRIAVEFGHVFALFFALAALLAQPPNFLLLLIALFIFVAASQEGNVVNIRTTLQKVRVKEILGGNFYTVSSSATVGEVLNLILHTKQEDFPVLEENKLAGFLARDKILQAVHAREHGKKVTELMLTEYPALKPTELLSSAYNKMENNRLKALPVIENGILKGIVTLEDISRIYSLFSKGEI